MNYIHIEGRVIEFTLNEVDAEQGYILERHRPYYDAKLTLNDQWVIVSGKLNAEDTTYIVDCYSYERVIDIHIEPVSGQQSSAQFFGS